MRVFSFGVFATWVKESARNAWYAGRSELRTTVGLGGEETVGQRTPRHPALLPLGLVPPRACLIMSHLSLCLPLPLLHPTLLCLVPFFLLYHIVLFLLHPLLLPRLSFVSPCSFSSLTLLLLSILPSPHSLFIFHSFTSPSPITFSSLLRPSFIQPCSFSSLTLPLLSVLPFPFLHSPFALPSLLTLSYSPSSLTCFVLVFLVPHSHFPLSYIPLHLPFLALPRSSLLCPPSSLLPPVASITLL